MSGNKFFRTEQGWRVLIRVLLAAFLVFPYLIWLANVSEWSWPAAQEWAPTFSYAIWQSFISTLLTVSFGIGLFQGLQSWSNVSLAEGLLLLPNIIPPVFFAMALLSLVTPLMVFPYGLGAVVFAHVLMNSGLVAISLDRTLRLRLGGMAEAAWVMGAKRTMFWREVVWPLARVDIAAICLFVFSLCLTSFSIPLLLSDRRSVSLEVAIYDMIRTEGRWDKAVILAALQALLLLLLAWCMPRAFWPVRSQRFSLQFLAQTFWRPFVLLPTLIAVLGWSVGWVEGYKEGLEDFVWQALPAAAMGTFALGLAVGLLHLLLFIGLAYVLPHDRLTRFLNGYLAPSSAITGFGLLLLPIEGQIWDGIRLVLALTFIGFPLLYRWIVHGALASLENQILVARSLGANWRLILLEVVWPQSSQALLRASALAGVWACGDFALSGILLNSNASLPLLIGDLLDNYRFAQAGLLLLPLSIVSLFVYFFFVKGARYVVD